MNTNDHDSAKRLDEYIDALNAGRPAPQVADDADLADLFATARDLLRLRAAEPARDDVPSRLAAALEGELRAVQTRDTRRIESNDVSHFKDASFNGSLPPPEDTGSTYAMPQRPDRAHQWAQFVVAAIAFVITGVVLATIIGGGIGDEPGGAVGTDPNGSPTAEAVPADSGQSNLQDDVEATPSTSEAIPTVRSIHSEGDSLTGTATVSRLETVQQALPTHQQIPAFDPAIPSLVVSPDFVSCDDTVTLHGASFEPGTTVAIFGGQLIGDNFGPVVDEHPVAEDGTFEVQFDLARLIGQCGGGDAEREGNAYRLYASTGNALVKNGIDPDGPTAMTVLTYSTDTPVGITDRVRLPSCGTEYIMNARMRDGLGPSPPNREARECFAAAAEAGALAEFTSHLVTDGFGIITTIYNSLGNGDVDIIVDGTRDPTASGEWVRYTCVFNALSDDGTTFRWKEYCSDPVTID